MAHSFLDHLPPERANAIRRRVIAQSRECERLHALSDRWLGEAVLKLARDVRSRVPAMADQTRERRTYEGYVLWEAIPEMARRVGCTLLPNEASDPTVRRATPWDLRMAVGHAYGNVSRDALDEASRPGSDLCPVEFLTREAANGSPIAMLLDRVAPPTPDSPDRIATHLREVCRCRGIPRQDAWSPAMDDYEGRSTSAMPVDDLDDELADAPSPMM